MKDHRLAATKHSRSAKADCARCHADGRSCQSEDGEPSAFSGLHQGAAIVAAGERFGAVGMLLSVDGEPACFVTAGHLFVEGARGVPVYAALPGDSRQLVGRLEMNLLDVRVCDCVFEIDAALVHLTDCGRVLAKATRHARAPRPAALLDIQAADRVQAFRPTTQDYSEVSEASLHTAKVYFEASARPSGYCVRGCMRTAKHVTSPGDSGTLFVSASDERAALGICIGSDERSTYIEPLTRALGLICAATGLDLQIWNGEQT